MIEIEHRQFDRDVARIQEVINHVGNTLKRDTTHVMRAAIVFALQSAAVATKPEGTSKLSRMKKKYRIRPLVSLTNRNFYVYEKTGKVFETPKRLKKERQRREGIRRLTKGIQWWDKKEGQFRTLPYDDQNTQNYQKFFAIPGAGAAKAAWLQAYNAISGKAIDVGKIKSVAHRTRQTTDFIEVLNLVGYAALTSPQAAEIGIAKAANKLSHLWMPRIERRLERDWNKKVTSFVKGLGTLT